MKLLISALIYRADMNYISPAAFVTGVQKHDNRAVIIAGSCDNIEYHYTKLLIILFLMRL